MMRPDRGMNDPPGMPSFVFGRPRQDRHGSVPSRFLGFPGFGGGEINGRARTKISR